MVETKIIILDQQEIVYKIHYKRIKNCYLRVEKGEVVIRCSPLFPQSEMFLNITIKKMVMFICLIKNIKLF